MEFLKKAGVTITPLKTGHVPLDWNMFGMGNSKTKKEGGFRIYKGKDGYAPIAAYLGKEGWCLGLELREGSQHNQCEFIWNPRKEDAAKRTARIFQDGKVVPAGTGKRVGLLRVHIQQVYKGKTYRFKQVLRVVERTIDRFGQCLLVPEIAVEGYWTTLDLPMKDVILLYEDHGTSEQFHREIKSDLDMERPPTGKSATNALILILGGLSYNILRRIGQVGLVDGQTPVRHPAKRRRIKIVIQQLMYLAARLVKTARRLKLVFIRDCPAFPAFGTAYTRFLNA